MNALSIVRLAAVVLSVAVLSGPATADVKGEGRYQAPTALVGSWRVAITPYDCVTLAVSPITFNSMLTFGAGGTVLETTSNTFFAPGQRSPGHGYWERTGPNFYHSVIEAFIVFSTPLPPPPMQPAYQRGLQRLTQGIEMQNVNRWTSHALVDFFDVGGTRVPPSGCAKAVGIRML
jgi:hypothetical protein